MTQSTETKTARLQRLLYDLLTGPRHAGSGALPTSIRFLFYELIQDKAITKKPIEKGKRLPSQDLSDALMELRRAGRIPWGWIVDETRALDSWRFDETVYAYASAAVDDARIDCWAGDPAPLILTESRSLAGVLRGVAARYLCPIAATNGQVGGFLHTDIIPALTEGQSVLYIGDEDLSGHQIEANTRRVIEAETGALAWERLLLTTDQVRDGRIESKETIDNRYKPARVTISFEAEALGQSNIQRVLAARLDDLLPEPLEDVRVREDEQRADVRAKLS
jgi:hypothetical protein